jgi:hypothetical protein
MVAIANLLSPPCISLAATADLHRSFIGYPLEAGRITHIPRRSDVAVLRRRTFPAVKGVVRHPRNIFWYGLLHSRLERTEGQAVPRLDPAFALADALQCRDGWVPEPDDVEFPEAEDAQRFLRAYKTLRVALDLQWLDAIRFASPDSSRVASNSREDSSRRLRCRYRRV